MSLVEFMVLDQFLSGVPEDLSVWLKKRKLQSLQQVVELADDYSLNSIKPSTAVVSTQLSLQGGGKPIKGRPTHSSQARAPTLEECSMTNLKGEKRSFHCTM